MAPYAACNSNDLLYILAAVIIGGTALTGGRGSVVGTLVGILLLGDDRQRARALEHLELLPARRDRHDPAHRDRPRRGPAPGGGCRQHERLDTTPALLEATDSRKHYGSIRAVNEIDLKIGHGEIVAIVGDNGAGKSTLIKMLSGAVTPDARRDQGRRGQPQHFHGPNDARAAGIETIYQDLALLPNLDVATNLFLGRESTLPAGSCDRSGCSSVGACGGRRASTSTSCTSASRSIWGTPVESLSGGQRQSVAIARALVWASKLVIMDEPTAALGVAQSRAVLDLVRRVRERGHVGRRSSATSCPHVIELADRVVVMRHGEKVADLPASEITQDRLIELIIGYERSA